jgi:hypothetical protein
LPLQFGDHPREVGHQHISRVDEPKIRGRIDSADCGKAACQEFIGAATGRMSKLETLHGVGRLYEEGLRTIRHRGGRRA